jgi:hypothetical protein
VTATDAAVPEGRTTPSSLWRSVGPGLVFLAAITGPGTILSNAVAGANYGYSLIWAFALSLLFRYVWVEATGRSVLVTGESLLQGYARVGTWLVWTVFGAGILVRHSTNLYTILLMGDAVHTLMPLPLAHSAAVWTVVFTLLGFAMMFWGGYPSERGCKVLMAILVGRSRPRRSIRSRSRCRFWPGCSSRPFRRTMAPTARYSSSRPIGAQVGTLSNLSYATSCAKRVGAARPPSSAATDL